jgi:hypothetical protein
MKKNIILAVTLAVICLTNLFAQENAKVKASVIQGFEKKFAGASNVKWESQPKEISLVQFRFENESWIAYYSKEGSLITSGRVIKAVDTLPIKVKESLQMAQDKYQSKYGTLAISVVYEMTNDKGTEYYIPMANSQVSLLVSLDESGFSSIRNKSKSNLTIGEDKTAIAKRN